MIGPYALDKWVWTEADFAQMSWHDCRIYAMAAITEDYEFQLDLDYIFAWIPPPGEEVSGYQFWVAPATLVFVNAYNIELDLGIFWVQRDVSIGSITRTARGRPRNAEYIGQDEEWDWLIDSPEGEIRLRAAGYNLYIRSQPRLLDRQSFGVAERGGISFATDPTNSTSA